MPIVGDAKKVKKNMEKQYGKKEGEKVFYATANKEGRTPETWKKKDKTKTASARQILKKLASNYDFRGPAVMGGLGAGAGAAAGAGVGAAVGLLRSILSKRARQRDGVFGTVAHGLGTGALIGGGLGAGAGAYAGHKSQSR